MTDEEWRNWVFSTLRDGIPLASLPQILGAGGMTVPPQEKPFMAIRFGPQIPVSFPGVYIRTLTLLAHDEPGDYVRVGGVLKLARAALVGPGRTEVQVPLPGAVACRWVGDSQDLEDPDFGTIVRTSDYTLRGRD